MIIIKRVLCFLIAIILSFNIVSALAAEENLSYSVLDLEDSAYIYDQGIGDGTVIYNVLAWRITGDITGENQNSAYNYSVFVKFDISDVDAESLKKAEMLIKRRALPTDGNGASHYITLRDIPDTSWVGSEINFTNNGVTDFAQYVDESKPVFAKFPNNILSEKTSLGYENCDDATDTVDITDYILEKKAEGKQYVSMCIALSTPAYVLFSIEKTAFIRITSTDNKRPKIVAQIAENASEGADYTFDFEVADEDNDNLKKVEVKFDDNVILSEEDITASIFSKSITIPASYVTFGEHTVTITATDENDRVSVYEANMYAAKVKTEIISNNGSSCTIKLKNITNSEIEIVVAAIAQGEGDEVNDVDFAGKKLAAGEEKEFTVSVDLQNGEIFKMFLWSGDKIFTPLNEIS